MLLADLPGGFKETPEDVQVGGCESRASPADVPDGRARSWGLLLLQNPFLIEVWLMSKSMGLSYRMDYDGLV